MAKLRATAVRQLPPIPPTANEPQHQPNALDDSLKHQQQQHDKKRCVAGVGQLAAAIAVAVVALAAAVLASNPLGWSLQRLNSDAASQHSRNAGGSATITAFLEWFEVAGGARHELVGIATFEGMGKGIVALQEISEHDQVLFVPMHIIICRETIAQSVTPALQHKFQQLVNSEDELLTAFVLLESLKSSKAPSRWRPYLQLLPKYEPGMAPSPLFYLNQEDIDALQDERIIGAAQQERRLAKRAFHKFRRLFKEVIAADPTTSSALLDLEARYMWTRFLISSRAFTIHGQRFLVPFGDVFNGQRHENTRRFENGQRFLQYHHFKDNGMIIRVDRTVAVGEQVFEDYGDNSNYVYFLHHGFLMQDNPFDCANLRLPVVDASPADVHAMKMRVLSHFGIEDAPSTCIMSDGSDSVSQESLRLAKFYFTLARTSPEDMRNACGQQHNYENCFLSTAAALAAGDNGDEFVAFVARAARQQLEKYPTSLVEDEELATRNDSLAPSLRSALAFRISRKRILHQALASLRNKLQHVDTTSEGAAGPTTVIEDVVTDAVPPTPSDDSPELRVDRFLQWIEAKQMPINHLTLRFVDDAMGYGTFATKALVKGEPYLSVPVDLVMDLRSAARSEPLRRLVRRLGYLAIEDDTLLLALHLLYEKFGPEHLRSHWKPYLDVLPTVETLETSSPLFFREQPHMELLAAADLHSIVKSYRSRVRQTFDAFKQQLQAGTRVDQSTTELEWITEKRFLWANAILDSRSIWWSGQRHLVPLLDMVNCLDLGVGHAAHHTDLTADDAGGEPAAVTRASWEFAEGKQVVENYAQPNYIYLLYHGFVLKANKHDCAHVSLATTDRVAINALPHPRKRALMEMLEALSLKTWTPELCIDPESARSIARFAKIAFITESPLLALEVATVQGIAHSEEATRQEIHAGLGVVANRLAALEIAVNRVGDEPPKDHPSRMIRAYLAQQHVLLTAISARLRQTPPAA